MAAGYGVTPYGEGDWGSENSFVPGVGTLSIQSEPPIVQTGIIPSGGAVLVGSAPVVIVVERVKTPDTAVVALAGQVPEVRTDFFIQPAANDAVITGFAPEGEQSAVLNPPTGAVSLVGAAPSLAVAIVVDTGALDLVGQTPEQGESVIPSVGAVVLAGAAPSLGFTIEPAVGSITAAGVAPIVVDEQVRIPGTADLDLVGQAPRLDSGVVPGVGSLVAAGFAPDVSQGEVVTPTGGAVLIGSAPVVIVRESVKTPLTRALVLVGQIPGVAQSKVITPPTGQLVLVGSAPVLKNPNWVNIDDSQTANWVAVAA